MARGRNKKPSEKVRGRNMQYIGSWISPELGTALDAWAKEEGRTRSSLITHLIALDFEDSKNVTLEDVLMQIAVLRESVLRLLTQRDEPPQE